MSAVIVCIWLLAGLVSTDVLARWKPEQKNVWWDIVYVVAAPSATAFVALVALVYTTKLLLRQMRWCLSQIKKEYEET